MQENGRECDPCIQFFDGQKSAEKWYQPFCFKNAASRAET